MTLLALKVKLKQKGVIVMDVTPTIEVALPELEVDIFINPRLEGLTVAPIEFVTPQEWEIFDEAPLDLGGQNPLIIG